MKSLRKFISVLIILFAINMYLPGQAPPPPGGDPTAHDSGQAPIGESGGGAPIGSGVALLLALGAAYGVKRYYSFKKAEA